MRGNNVPINDPILLEKALPRGTFTSLIAHSLRNEVDETIETLNRLSLFTEDSGVDHLLSNLTHIISQGKIYKTRQSSINNFCKQQ